MKKNSLSTVGLSMTQAQSISNICNQRAQEIDNKLNNVNNYSSMVKIGTDAYQILPVLKYPEDWKLLLYTKAKLHSVQSFLMENIKAKSELLDYIKKDVVELGSFKEIEKPKYVNVTLLPNVTENFGWEQLSISEMNEFLEVEAMAAHLGQFIHSGSTLAQLRKSINDIPQIEWIDIEKDKKTPVTNTIHNDQDMLMSMYETIAKEHRVFEQRVNYFKAKVKNLTTEENARISKLNSIEQNRVNELNREIESKYNTELNALNMKILEHKKKFEIERHTKLSEAAALRIKVDSRFSEIIDSLLKEVIEEK